jgi:hypothetical protein
MFNLVGEEEEKMKDGRKKQRREGEKEGKEGKREGKEEGCLYIIDTENSSISIYQAASPKVTTL